MAVTGKIYGKLFLSAFNKEIDAPDDTFKCMLTTATYTPDQDVHQYKSSVTNEVTGTGYTAGGQTLTTVVFTYTAATNVVMFDCDDPTWTGSSLVARTAVFYDGTPGTDATRPLLVYQQSDADITSTAGPFTVQINAAGLFTITVA